LFPLFNTPPPPPPGLLSNIDLNRVDPEFHYFNKFYLHYLKLAAFQQDEVANHRAGL